MMRWLDTWLHRKKIAQMEAKAATDFAREVEAVGGMRAWAREHVFVSVREQLDEDVRRSVHDP